MISARVFYASAIVAALALGGCQGGSVSPPPFNTGSPVFTITAGGSSNMEAMQSFRFYPSSLTVNVGDTVHWAFPSGEPHTVTLLGPRTAYPPPTDPTSAQPFGGPTYDATTYTSSGFLLLGKSYSLTFTNPGTYTYTCLLHGPAMRGTIVVQPSGTPYPPSNTVAELGASAAQAADLALGTTAVSQFPYAPGGPHLVAGLTPGLTVGPPSPVAVQRFLDGPSLAVTSVTVHVGDIVTWTNQSNNAPHTVTIAPVGAPFPILNPFAPPTGGNVYDGTMLVNSGVLFSGASFSLKFTTVGTFTYQCLFHDDTEHMIGTVIVQ
ncbi:hypothetical protein WPS_30550 [Vulcanimicrobium alpinum]|uniref:Blue (type 1) copper domain-containing protein n=1 Tax=Vulcanimicrobium alpinum TaxID=3016050 RepID=A0AAN1XZF9_UNVUL|nr:plastocyanin/azurin family copper-binding protein [Vulcanimicrobium alpinum]BDE07779.1 hypothetical protein WPS_30550 [Vulcanimicrobium alpinum]